jgi:diguanylate cyclase (GGDEF)-like protein
MAAVADHWLAAVVVGLVALLGAGLLVLARVRRWDTVVITFRGPDPGSGARGRRWLPRLRRIPLVELQDPLTGLATRDTLTEHGPRVLAAAADAGRRVGVLLLDLDGFKSVNDILGHQSGDRVLAEVGRRIDAQSGPEDLAARLGGDEFVLVLVDADADALRRRTDDLVSVLASPIHLDEVSWTVRPSVGLAVHPDDGASLGELLRVADEAMYDAKAATASWQRVGTAAAGRGRLEIGPEDLAAALRREELVVHYQPQVNGWSGAVTGFEALVRWQHPELGMLLPDRFLPQIERSPVIADLTRWVLARALADLPALQRSAPGATVAVNVSARSMMGNRLLADLGILLEETGVPARDLVLEITEPAPRATTEVRALLEGLRSLGCGVSVHGFGSAQTSLTALWQLPAVREIKIDPELVRTAASDPEAERLCRAMISAARGLDVRVVAEGVEDTETVHRLRGLGCDAFQGYLLGTPVPLDEVPAWATGWHGDSARLLGR